MSSGTNLAYIAAFYFLPLSDLNTIKYSYIVWAAILSVIFLKDPFKFINGCALVLTVVGIVLATKSQFFLEKFLHLSNSWQTDTSTATVLMLTTTNRADDMTSSSSSYYYLGICLAVVSSLTKSIQVIARKQLINRKQPHSVMNFQFTVVALFVTVAYSLIRRYWQASPYPWTWMCTAGVVIGFCQLATNAFYAKALKRENVQLLSILGTLDIIYAVILQYVFFRQTKSWIFYVGASFVVLSAIFLSIDSYKTNQKKKTTTTTTTTTKTTMDPSGDSSIKT
jgi:drug/metabolite transporter (DMT)-like permease